eukprot:14396790-Alexandrium_andersonii.AAC.2
MQDARRKTQGACMASATTRCTEASITTTRQQAHHQGQQHPVDPTSTARCQQDQQEHPRSCRIYFGGETFNTGLDAEPSQALLRPSRSGQPKALAD